MDLISGIIVSVIYFGFNDLSIITMIWEVPFYIDITEEFHDGTCSAGRFAV
jgi:hypothetical protein